MYRELVISSLSALAGWLSAVLAVRYQSRLNDRREGAITKKILALEIKRIIDYINKGGGGKVYSYGRILISDNIDIDELCKLYNENYISLGILNKELLTIVLEFYEDLYRQVAIDKKDGYIYIQKRGAMELCKKGEEILKCLEQ